MIDAVYEECQYTTQGLVLKSLEYLTENDFKKNFKLPIKTKDLLPTFQQTNFTIFLNDNFLEHLYHGKTPNDAEFEERKKEYLESGRGCENDRDSFFG